MSERVSPDDYARDAGESLLEAARLMRKVMRAKDRMKWAQTDGAEALRLVRAARGWCDIAERDLASALDSWERKRLAEAEAAE